MKILLTLLLFICFGCRKEVAPNLCDKPLFYNVRSYISNPCNEEDVTNGIQKAINDCSKAGGGIVFIPNDMCQYPIPTLKKLKK